MENLFISGTTMMRVSRWGLTFDGEDIRDIIRKGLKLGEGEDLEVPVEVYIEILPYNLGLKVTNEVDTTEIDKPIKQEQQTKTDVA